ncbi:CTP synthase [Pancytospora epiphaga]|nr:CTP synthase [Pancytospora epiphaga]
MKYVFTVGKTDTLVNNRTIPGVLGLAIQSTGRNVTYLNIEQSLNTRIDNIDLRETGEIFVLADGTEVPLRLGAFERCCGAELTADSHVSIGKIMKECINSLEKGTNTSLANIETAVHEYIKRHIEAMSTRGFDYLLVDIGDAFYCSNAGSSLIASAIVKFISSLPPADFIFLNVEDKAEAEAENFYETGALYGEVGNFIKNTNNSPEETCIFSLLISKEDNSCCLCNYSFSNTGIDITQLTKETFSSLAIFRLFLKVPFLGALSNSGISHESRLLAQDDLINTEDAAGRVSAGDRVKIGILSELGPEYRPYYSIELALKQVGVEKGRLIEVVYIMLERYEEGIEEIGEDIEGFSGILAPGGFGEQYLETKLAFVKYARLNNIPFIGICLGHQIAIIEFARNVLKIREATSEEFNNSSAFPVIRKVPSIRCTNTGRDIFLGNYPVEYRESGRAIYSTTTVVQRFRHRYALNNIYKKELEKFGMVMIGKSTNDRVVAFRLRNHRFFVGVQYHPELNTACAEVDSMLSAFVCEALGNEVVSKDN